MLCERAIAKRITTSAVAFTEVEDSHVGKQEKTEAELEELIAQRIVVGGVYVSVRPDPLLGWRPMVITAPKHATYAQKMADDVAAELRKTFALKQE
jgi:hypothetical protein